MNAALGRHVRRVGHAAEGPALRAALRLPAGALRRLGGRPTRVDGQVLDPEMQAILRLARLSGEPAVETLPIPEGRRRVDRQSAVVGGRQPIGSVADRVIEGPGGPLRLRLYTPRGLTGRAPLLMFMHGGGWIYGSLDSHDPVCRFLAERAGVRVASIDYRLAPEHPFPAALDDCLHAYGWVRDHAEVLQADPERIAVGGDSAGANLAAVVAWMGRDSGRPPAYQLLLYPATDVGGGSASRRAFGEGYYLTSGFIDLATTSYVPAAVSEADPRVSPLALDHLRGLCSAYVVTAGFDPLRDEGEAYARRLANAGVPVELRRFPTLIHSFVNMVGVGRSAPAAMAEVAATLRLALTDQVPSG